MSAGGAKIPSDFGVALAAWAQAQSALSGLILIGSRARVATDLLEFADAHSDWDYHVITSDPAMFGNRAWTSGLVGQAVKAYAVRPAAIGGVVRINLVFDGGEADLIVIPAGVLWWLKVRLALGFSPQSPRLRRRMQDIAEVIRPGWRFVKGESRWGRLYQRCVDAVVDPHLTDAAACRLAEGFVYDYIWTVRKLDRGELVTAQRLLHRELGELNLQLLHELKRRRGERTFPKARRLERVATAKELRAVAIDARLDAQALRAAVEQSAETFRSLMAALVGEAWRWPV